MLNNWALRRHNNKGSHWIYQKYFQRANSTRNWHFHAKLNNNERNVYFNLKLAGDTKIKRHTKIIADANPYDPQYFKYFRIRETSKRIALSKALSIAGSTKAL